MEYAELPTEVDEIKRAMQVRRIAIQRMLGDNKYLGEILEQKIGKIAFLQYMAEVAQSAEGSIFGKKNDE